MTGEIDAATSDLAELVDPLELPDENELPSRVLEAAAVALPVELRPLDAIHLATADLLGEDLGTLVKYDDRMSEAAVKRGHRVAAPS